MGSMNIQKEPFCVDEIEHDRQARVNTKTIQGTRKLQCDRTIAPYIVETRNLSCFCNGCNLGLNASYVEPWNRTQIRKGGDQVTCRRRWSPGRDIRTRGEAAWARVGGASKEEEESEQEEERLEEKRQELEEKESELKEERLEMEEEES